MHTGIVNTNTKLSYLFFIEPHGIIYGEIRVT